MTETRWLLLIHQIPPKPNYFRVKIWRHMQRIGAVAMKNSVYILPKSAEAQEDFQWVLREIVGGGGDATLCEAHLIEGLGDESAEALFQAARDADYHQLAEEIQQRLEDLGPAKDPREGSVPIEAELTRLHRRLAEIAAIDFFDAPGRPAAAALLADLEARLRPPASMPEGSAVPRAELRGRTWVTRKGIHIDRIGSAWLIRRFIDPEAHFKFVPPRGYQPEPGELRFDMFEAEFTHEGDRCTFEVLIERMGLSEPGLGPLAEIVHDIDLKDGKFGRPEAAGLAGLVAGLSLGHRDDEDRLARGAAVFDDLYAYFNRKHPVDPGPPSVHALG